MYALRRHRFPSITRAVALPLLGFLLAVVLTAFYIRGTRIEAERSATSYLWRYNIPKLLYGDLLPDFRLTDTKGRVWTPSDIPGSWTLLVFGTPSCSACRSQWADLNAVMSSEPKYRVLAVISGAPLLGSLADICERFAAEYRLNYPVLIDEGGGLAKRVCDPMPRIPFSVLLDPRGRVRYIFQGYQGNVLRQHIHRIMQFRGISVRSHRKPFPIDGEVNDHGVRKGLRDVIGQGWTVLTFSKNGCPKCSDRVNILARFRYGPQVRCFLLYGSPQEAEHEDIFTRGLGIRCISSPASDLPKKFGAHFVPLTFIFYNGSLARAELSQGTAVDLWNFLGAVTDGRTVFEKKRSVIKNRPAVH